MMKPKPTKPKRNYQRGCFPVSFCTTKISQIFAHPSWRIRYLIIKGVTPEGSTVRLKLGKKPDA